MTTNNGGPAFPFAATDTSNCDMQAQGMSLRDYFAAKAMQGWLASYGPNESCKASSLAQFAYEIADAMISAKEE